jgi:hypothetical protein
VENECYDGPRASGVVDINEMQHRFTGAFDQEEGEYLGAVMSRCYNLAPRHPNASSPRRPNVV